MAIPAADVTVIVRSVAERTTDPCRHLLESQVPPENVVLVEDLAYENYVTGTYEVGMEHDRPWTLVVDADVLPRKSMVETFREIADGAAPELFASEAQVVDKFTGGPRGGGGTLYRTRLLETAFDLVPRSDDVARPETAAIRRMQERGYDAYYEGERVIGVHDFEQSYADIYRKANRYSRKDKHAVPVLCPYWRRRATDDADFEVMVAVTEWARRQQGSMSFEASQFEAADVETLLDRLGLEEKPQLAPDDVSFGAVEKRVDVSPPPEHYRHRRLGRIRESPYWSRLPRPLRYLLILSLQKSPLKTPPWVIGNCLERLGRRFKRAGE